MTLVIKTSDLWDFKNVIKHYTIVNEVELVLKESLHVLCKGTERLLKGVSKHARSDS